MTLALLAGTAVLATIISASLIRLLWPLLVRYALARPNGRSSHVRPTPQGGGIAVLAATVTAAGGGLALFDAGLALPDLAVPVLAAIGLACLGGIDDIRPLPALPRLMVQILCVAAVVTWADPGLLLRGLIPVSLERTILILAGVWWVNLVNFMDGIDWITIAECVPLSGAVAVFAFAGYGSPASMFMAAAMFGGLLGFAPFNRPVARLFLGDVGSLPIGLLTGWMLLDLVGRGAVAAAILIPFYYLADATLTLLARLIRGENVTQAHRLHFYQRAHDNGWSSIRVDKRVFSLNLALVALAAVTIQWPRPWVTAACLLIGCLLVGRTLKSFAAR